MLKFNKGRYKNGDQLFQRLVIHNLLVIVIGTQGERLTFNIVIVAQGMSFSIKGGSYERCKIQKRRHFSLLRTIAKGVNPI